MLCLVIQPNGSRWVPTFTYDLDLRIGRFSPPPCSPLDCAAVLLYDERSLTKLFTNKTAPLPRSGAAPLCGDLAVSQSAGSCGRLDG